MTVYTFNSTGAGCLNQTGWVNKRMSYVSVFFLHLREWSQHMCKSNWDAQQPPKVWVPGTEPYKAL